MKPSATTLENATYFKDESIVSAYRHRAPYPPQTFDIVETLIADHPRRVLDAGCGTGEIARRMVTRADHVDAVDLSLAMIEAGRQLPNGGHPNLRWFHGPIESTLLDPPYGLVTAGASLHWMDWSVVLPLFHRSLVPGGTLAILSADARPHPWEMIGDVVSNYREDGGLTDWADDAHCY